MKQILFSLFLIGISSTQFLGCSQTEFSSEMSDSQNNIENPPKGQKTVVKLTRDINTTSNIDMVWVIDNSVSMIEEINIIRENLGYFLLSIEDRAHLNFTVITNNKGNYGMALSPWALSRGYVQIPQAINSRDSLIRFLEHLPKMRNLSLRANSQKIIVVVTDDNSDLSANVFLKSLQSSMNLSDVKLFGFVGLGRTESPCMDNVGTHYINLAHHTGGKVFNICETDWRPHFDTLIKDVGTITKTEFTLPSRPKSDLVVTVDGLVTQKYSLNGRTLVIHPDNFTQNKKYNIEVSYF